MFARILALTIMGCIAISLSSCRGGLNLDDKPSMGEEAIRQQNLAVRAAMQRIQFGVEHYAADHGGNQYPTKIDDVFKSYMPGGVEGERPAPAGPVNGFSGKNEFPTLGTISDVHAVRFGQRFAIPAGAIVYSPLNNGQAYAITGGAADGKILMDEKNPGQVLVLSNLEDE